MHKIAPSGTHAKSGLHGKNTRLSNKGKTEKAGGKGIKPASASTGPKRMGKSTVAKPSTGSKAKGPFANDFQVAKNHPGANARGTYGRSGY